MAAASGSTHRPTVLQVLPALESGGVERGTIDMARFLVKHGWRALVASEGGRLERDLGMAGGEHVKLPLASKNPATIALNTGRLKRLIREQGIDLVHARSRAPAWSARSATRSLQVPFVTTFHAGFSGWDNPLKKRYSCIMASGDRVIAISDFIAEHVREQCAVPLERLRVVHRGVDLDYFDPAKVNGLRVAKLTDAWNLEPDLKVIMLAGRVSRVKGHEVLVRALMRLKRDDFVCLFVGGAERNDSFVTKVDMQARAAGLAGAVRFVGTCNDMPAAYAIADVVVVPSIHLEAFGRVSAEAQAMGKPVIVSNVGGLSETLMPMATGWLVEPDNPEELAEALDLALDMAPDVKTRLSQRARSFVAGQYNAETMCRRTEAIYRELLDGRIPLPPRPADTASAATPEMRAIAG